MALSVQRYEDSLNERFKGSKLKKYSYLALDTAITFGLSASKEVFKHAQDIKEETKTVKTEPRTRKVVNKRIVLEDDWIDVPPTFAEMLPIARKEVKHEVKRELADYLN
jgi:phosphoribosylpyrophosphate synthetase